MTAFTSVNRQIDFLRYSHRLILGRPEYVRSAGTVVGVEIVTFHRFVIKEILLQRMSGTVFLYPLNEAAGAVETYFQFLRIFRKTITIETKHKRKRVRRIPYRRWVEYGLGSITHTLGSAKTFKTSFFLTLLVQIEISKDKVCVTYILPPPQ